MPGVLIIEALAQAAGILAFKTVNVVPDLQYPLLFRGDRQCALPQARRAGRSVHAEGDAQASLQGHLEIRRVAEVDGKEVASAELMVAPEAKSPKRGRRMIDSRAVISPQAHIASDVRSGPSPLSARMSVSARGTWIGPHAVINGPTQHRHGQQDLSVRLLGRCAAGQEIQGRADAPRDRRPQRVPRMRHREPRHHPRSGRDAHRRRQSTDGVFACGA